MPHIILMKIEDKLNEVTNNVYGFTMQSATLDSATDVCYVEFLYNDGTILTPEAREACQKAVEEYLPNCYTYNIKFTKNYIEKNGLADYISDYFRQNHPSTKFTIKQLDLQNSRVNIEMSSLQKAYCEATGLQRKLADDLSEHFKQTFSVTILFTQDEIADFYDDFDAPTSLYMAPTKTIQVTEKSVIYGTEIVGEATYIRDSLRAGSEVTFCGYLKNAGIRFTKPKKIPEGKTEQEVQEYLSNSDVPLAERAEYGQRPMFKFKIEDFTGMQEGVVFFKKEEYAIFAGLKDDMQVIMQGRLEESKYNGALNFRPNSISSCVLPDVWEEEIDYLPEKPFYEYVKPQKVVATDQADFFSFGEKKEVAPYLKNHQIVVFDFETTGLNPYQGDKIIEIGAVKLIDGVITEQFVSLVNPGVPIPSDSTKVHHITDEDVAGAPSANQALQDFYKFTRGCVLSGYNIVGFDCNFLSVQGKQARYKFDNPTIDVYPLAQRYVKDIKNYKLKTVAKHLGVTLDNAHSALYDTIATAEVLIKLAGNIV